MADAAAAWMAWMAWMERDTKRDVGGLINNGQAAGKLEGNGGGARSSFPLASSVKVSR